MISYIGGSSTTSNVAERGQKHLTTTTALELGSGVFKASVVTPEVTAAETR